MNTSFLKLLEVEIQHGYYGGICSDLAFIPITQSPGHGNLGLVTRVRPGRLVVLSKADVPLPTIAPIQLVIGLRVVEPGFSNVTAEPFEPGTLALYGNRGGSRTLEPPQEAQLLKATHTVVPTRKERPVTLRWEWDGQTLVERVLGIGEEQALFDTRSWPPGRCTLVQTMAGGSDEITQWLQAPELAKEPIWGALVLTLNPAFRTDPPLFRLSLQTRSDPIDYYVVTKNFSQGEVGTLDVRDASNDDPVNFQRFDPDDFPDDALDPDSFGEKGNAATVLFRSQRAIARKAIGSHRFQLRRNDQILFKDLPHPGKDRANATFIVHLSKTV